MICHLDFQYVSAAVDVDDGLTVDFLQRDDLAGVGVDVEHSITPTHDGIFYWVVDASVSIYGFYCGRKLMHINLFVLFPIGNDAFNESTPTFSIEQLDN